jgi:ribosomal protein S18 acetylase RimI-like enzyme
MAPIRRALPADQPAIEAIVNAAYSKHVALIGRPPGPMLDDYGALIAKEQVFVLEDGTGIIGLTVFFPEPGGFVLDNVAIAPAGQGKGHGRRLIAFAEEAARRSGSPTIRLYTNEVMTRNIALYTRLGYVQTHRSEGKGYQRVFMTKLLIGDSAE